MALSIQLATGAQANDRLGRVNRPISLLAHWFEEVRAQQGNFFDSDFGEVSRSRRRMHRVVERRVLRLLIVCCLLPHVESRMTCA